MNFYDNTKGKKVIFLDRDGVINKLRKDHVKTWKEFEFLPNVSLSINRLNKAGYTVIVITNQSVIGKGLSTEKEIININNKMTSELKKRGAHISKIFYCPHRPKDNCKCRKPKIGLFEQAHQAYDINTDRSFFIGDSKTDILAGIRAGVEVIKVGNFEKEIANHNDNFISYKYCKSINEASKWIISKEGGI